MTTHLYSEICPDHKTVKDTDWYKGFNEINLGLGGLIFLLATVSSEFRHCWYTRELKRKFYQTHSSQQSKTFLCTFFLPKFEWLMPWNIFKFPNLVPALQIELSRLLVFTIHDYRGKKMTKIIVSKLFKKPVYRNSAISVKSTYFLGFISSFSVLSWTKFIKFALRRISVAIRNHYIVDPKCAPNSSAENSISQILRQVVPCVEGQI